MSDDFYTQTKQKIHRYVKLVYSVSKEFPKDERYGMTSQFRRASLSIMLNFVEGYARFKKGQKLHFWEIAYGSLKESKYLLFFAYTEGHITDEDYQEGLRMTEEIGKMLWQLMKPLRYK